MCTPLNGKQPHQNVDKQRHCILVAASNPFPLPTPVFRPQIPKLEQSENTESQKESRISDAETLAKFFPQVLFMFYTFQVYHKAILYNVL